MIEIESDQTPFIHGDHDMLPDKPIKSGNGKSILYQQIKNKEAKIKKSQVKKN